MDGLNKVVQVPGDMNPDPRGLDPGHSQPMGGLRYYQDDLDTNSKQDLATEEIGDDPSKRHVQEVGHNKAINPEDLREEVEDQDEADRD